MADFLRHTSCDSCKSSDANAVYSDGSTFCFACNKSTKSANAEVMDTSTKPTTTALNPYFDGAVEPLAKRGIHANTCEKYGVRKGMLHGEIVHLYPYYKDNALVAAKTRNAAKEFRIIGATKDLDFFGQQLFRAKDNLTLTVTEGEIDALSLSQVMGNKWPVVSVPSGAQSAAKVFRKNIEWLEGFKDVVIMFDMDEPGQKAALECAEILSPGKARIASLPLKDANEMLLANKTEELLRSYWDAKPFRPDGIVAGGDLWEQLVNVDEVKSVPYPFQSLNAITRGMRRGELVTVTSGTGIGKSAFMRETAYHLINNGEKVGMIMLEESPRRTAQGLVGLALNKPYHLDPSGVTTEELRDAFDKTLGTGRLWLFDHFGSSEVEHLMAKIRYMVKGLGCDWIILDHLSILVSGMEGVDERRLLDNAMTMLRTFVEETQCGLLLVSHLKRAEGKSHEEGGQTSLAQLRGSHAIAQLSDLVIGLERNQQGDNPNITQMRVLKNRFSGETGEAGKIEYSKFSGRLAEWAGVEETSKFNTEF